MVSNRVRALPVRGGAPATHRLLDASTFLGFFSPVNRLPADAVYKMAN
jgi:hypothetical protein